MADTAKAGKAPLLIHIHTPSTAPFPCRELEGTQKGSQIQRGFPSPPWWMGSGEPHTRWPLHLPAPELRALWKSISATKKHPREKTFPVLFVRMRFGIPWCSTATEQSQSHTELLSTRRSGQRGTRESKLHLQPAAEPWFQASCSTGVTQNVRLTLCLPDLNGAAMAEASRTSG